MKDIRIKVDTDTCIIDYPQVITDLSSPFSLSLLQTVEPLLKTICIKQLLVVKRQVFISIEMHYNIFITRSVITRFWT